MLSEKTIEIVKSTAPVVKEYGTKITKVFYKKMLGENPELLNYFNHVNQKVGSQPTALANSIIAAAENIDNLEAIIGPVKTIAHKHRALSIRPEHYPIVGENLLYAIKEVLGDAATDEILKAWEEAYGEIANVFIQIEAKMYEEAALKRGGWADFKPFTVVKKVKESDEITSFYLKALDGTPVPEFQPGQYITVKVVIPGEKFVHNRHYSLSQAPGKEYFRISVKREADREPIGKVSNYLHDQVNEGDLLDVSAPAGEFILNTAEEEPVTFIAGGVGITPLYSMFETLVDNGSKRDVTFIQAARNEKVRAFADDLKELVAKAENAKLYTVLDEKVNEDTEVDLLGHINREFLEKVVKKDSVVYLCGPQAFMKAMVDNLTAIGVAEEKIRYELFGPQLQGLN
ncbi:NO-inducible flavohemoprotein [Pallidibacillus pasinlerensis]|uniref:Flavohemoprotein n=1 Tax=Pallidibacillus pasinlerensis TaxID=2703818 RepID=A0ABX0A2Z0_9BACI|nr:NO-inducible flavohemoprotein [Pallidibacillus pasinlerensis]NCU17809.1 NO-inducible flavohemoprotein [Pallidibacillus pasinlerensis]